MEDEPAAEGAGITKRKLLIPVDDSTESERALLWTLEEMYRWALPSAKGVPTERSQPCDTHIQ